MVAVGRLASGVDKVVAVDQGTTATKAYVLAMDGRFEEIEHLSHPQILPRQGWVEHDPELLLANVARCIESAGAAAALGIDNQGETVVAWDALTGRPLCNAIVWQDTRTRDVIDRLKAEGVEAETLERAGLPLDAYFSAAKLRWMLDNVGEARDLARQGRLRLGTTDAFFLDRLTGTFATDVSTASRTSLMNIHTLTWDETLCKIFGVPGELLPEVRSSTGNFGEARVRGGALPVTASVMDQGAALFGHRCFSPGHTKITFGTGAFALSVTGNRAATDAGGGLLRTVSWQLAGDQAVYALDGGVYNAGSAVNWAQAQGLFMELAEIDHFDSASAISRGIVCVPAFSGLACPFWDRKAAGLFLGIGLDTSRADFCQALLEGIALRSAQVIHAMGSSAGKRAPVSIDGGLARNSYFRQFLSDALGRPTVVPEMPDVTGLGTAWLAMLGAGLAVAPGVLPGPQGTAFHHEPRSPVGEAAHARFAEAVERSRDWWW